MRFHVIRVFTELTRAIDLQLCKFEHTHKVMCLTHMQGNLEILVSGFIEFWYEGDPQVSTGTKPSRSYTSVVKRRPMGFIYPMYLVAEVTM